MNRGRKKATPPEVLNAPPGRGMYVAISRDEIQGIMDDVERRLGGLMARVDRC